MFKRINDYTLEAEPGDILTEEMCKYTARYAEDNRPYTEITKGPRGFYNYRWPGAEEIQGVYIATMRIWINVSPEFQTNNEWGEVAP